MTKKKIKICALTTISKTMDWFIVDSMRNLSKNGYDVTLICSMDDGFKERNQDYATCINIPMSRGSSLKDLLTIPFKLAKLFKSNKYDLIYYTSPNVSLYSSIAGFIAGVKTRVYCQYGLRYISLKGIKHKVFWLVEKMTCTLSTTIRSASPMNMQIAIDEGLCRKNKISVVGIGGTIGVDLKQCDSFDHSEARHIVRSQYSIPENAFVFGFVGRINADKGINELIEAFISLKHDNDNLYLMLIGMMDDSNPISESNLKIANCDSQIIMTGNIPSEKIYSYMTAFDVLVHPTYREGFGKVLQEAMGVGIPVITTNIPGASEVIEKDVSGILVEPKDVNDLKSKMLILHNNPGLCASLACEGRKRAEKYFDRPIMLSNILMDLNGISRKMKSAKY